MTLKGVWRENILRIYWDGQEQPSVECPVGDFFACGWGSYAQISSLAVCVNPARAFNSYWEMPFRKRARITMTNIGEEETTLYYQVSYALTEVPEDCAYFHAQFRRVNPLPYKQDYTIVEGIRGPRPLRRHGDGLGSQQLGLVGRGRDQVLHGRRRRVPHHLRDGHRGLLLRRLQLRRRGRQRRLPRVHDALLGPARRCRGPTGSTGRSSASASTAGTSRTRSASRRT